MLNKLTKRQALGLALLPITLLLSLAIVWLYSTVRSSYGTAAAVLTLTVVTIIILTLICKGIQYAVAIEKAVQRRNTIHIDPSETKDVMEPCASEISEHPQGRMYKPDSQAYKRRGKHPRFPIRKIAQAVLKWERRDPQFISMNLTEFLEQEFGCGPDGILLMAPTTFYDWRRRILNDPRLGNKNRSTTDPGADM